VTVKGSKIPPVFSIDYQRGRPHHYQQAHDQTVIERVYY